MPAPQFHRFAARLATLFVLTCTAALAQTTIHVPADQPTIQAGINAANTGDTVLVAPGTYYENIDFKGEAITVTSSNGAATTTIDGGNNAPTVTFQSGEPRTSILFGFTIQNGAEGGTGYGQLAGGIAILSSSPSIEHNVVTRNYANNIRVGYGAPLIEDNIISNSIPGTGRSLSAGSGLYIEGTAASCTASQLANCVTVLDNTIENNSRPVFGGGGGISIDGYNYAVIVGNTIQNNSAGSGAGIYTVNTDSVYIVNNLITQNSENYGGSSVNLGPPYFTVGPFSGVIANNTVVNNTGGGQITVGGNVSLFLFVNNIVVANNAFPAVTCGTPFSGTTPASFDHNDLYNPTGGAFSGCDIPSGLYGNISVDPLFVNTTSDFHLQPGSPAIDAGNSSSPLLTTVDLDGKPRFGNTSSSGYEIVDMGAYESYTTAAPVFPAQSSISVTPSAYIQTTSLIQLTAQLGSSLGTPQGTVTFLFDNVPAGSVTVDASGVARFDTSGLAVGTHAITAQYSGGGMFSPSVSVKFYIQIQTVLGTAHSTTTLASSLNPSIINQNVHFTATVTSANGTPTGSIQFTDNGTAIGTQTLDATGLATLSTSTLTVGTHNITASYIPTGSFAGSSTSITQTVNDVTDAVNITSSLNPSTYGQPVTITLHTTPSNGVVVPGTAVFSEGSQFLGTQPTDASGNASITISTLTVGAHLITVAFTPTGTSHTYAGTITQQVNGLASRTILSATPLTGIAHITTITLTATVIPAEPAQHLPAPAGQVIFYVNGTQLGTATLVNAVATYSGTLPAGTDQIYAAYVGDPNQIFLFSNSNTLTVTITAAPSTLSLTSGLNPAPAFTPFNLSAQLTLANGSAVGAGYPITFTIAQATTAQATTNASGIATYTSFSLPPGQYLVTATFAGTTDLQPSTAVSFIETISANPTATTLTASPNPGIQNNPVTFTSTVSALAGTASPEGTVTIYDSLSPSTAFTSIATLTMRAGITTETFTTSALAPGTHILYAAFTPTAGFAPSQSAQITLVIDPQSFTLTLSEPNLSLQTGHHHTETASLTSIGGLTGTFTLSCGTLPQYASCSWTQTSVTLPANGTVSTSLTIDTDQLLGFVASNTRTSGGPSMPRSLRHEWEITTAFTLLPLTLLGFRRRRKLSSLLPLLILAALATTLTACGANQYPYSTTPGTYTVQVTAVGTSAPGAASPTQTVNLTLVVTR